MAKKQKLVFSEWIENIWYHYKWLIIFGTLFLAAVIISIVQFNRSKNPDVNTLFVGPWYLSPSDVEEYEDSVGGLSKDYNGDDEVKVNLLAITIAKLRVPDESGNEDSLVNFDERNRALTRFQTEIRAGNSVIYFLDKEFFDICVELNILCPLSEVIDDAYMPENVIDGCGITLSSLDAYSLNGISKMPPDTILCLRRSPEEDEITYGRKNEVWDGNRQTFVNIVKYHK